ncbi:GH39 family glycosyl hydrolase [Promicromonospora kroppenstedtii]|uniref:GH39 family glycosyl hydrolase n=1 Tax=Promicromonospora kroppenstedtii TaxID=440482 RepID=UPI0004BBBB62|nr:beta-xylosidase [Promicromonospora kroppenstedtii]
MHTHTTPGLTIDGEAATAVPLRHIWNECVGAGRANEALRADWQAHFREAVTRLGARFVRFHGLFHDDMFVYRANDGGGFGPPVPLDTPVHTFSYVDKVFDFILETGARPFVELGFMPRELATETETLFWWKAHCSPPTDMARWVELVTATVTHWIDRYGIDEVRQWRFEVWNEPNLVPHFWTGTRTQYFELYEATALAIKEIDRELKVGGPSTSVFVPDDRYRGEWEDRSVEHATAEAEDVDALDWRPVWIQELIDWCAARDVPVDFLSTHLYPTDVAFGANGQMRHIRRHVDATHDDLVALRKLIAGSPFPDAELHITEWSSSPSSRDSIHDTLFAATYITRAYLRGAALADSISYWTFTDVFEEGGAGIGPFHGGFGMVNEQGLHKPTFHAFEMLSRLGDTVLAALPYGAITQDSATHEVSALFFNYPDDMGRQGVGSELTYAATRGLAQRGPARRVRHTVAGLTPGAVFAVESIDWDHGNVAEAWHRMGEPLNLTPAQVAELRESADALRRTSLTVSGDGVLDLDLELPAWAVLSITPARG